MERSTRKFLSTALAVPVLSITIMQASPSWAQSNDNRNFLEKIFSNNKNTTARATPAPAATAPVDPRMVQLEQAVRDLTGLVEDLNFKILQMQNQIDVLEGKPPRNSAIPMPQAVTDGSKNNVANTAPAPQASGKTPDNTAAVKPEQNDVGRNNSRTTGALPQDLGSVRFDSEGNIISSTAEPGSQDAMATGNATTSIPETATSKELYQIGYQHILAGDYRAAENVFRAYQERYPTDPMIADATFWLGESLYGQGRYREAAQSYMDVQRNYRDMPRGPENLLKLGMSMAKLDKTEVACATLAEVPKRYKKAEPAILKRVSDERNRLQCPL